MSATHEYERDQAALNELGRRADAVYDQYVEPHLTPADNGKLVALDVDTGDYEIGDDDGTFALVDRLKERRPGATTYLFRAGTRYVDTFGWFPYETR